MLDKTYYSGMVPQIRELCGGGWGALSCQSLKQSLCFSVSCGSLFVHSGRVSLRYGCGRAVESEAVVSSRIVTLDHMLIYDMCPK